jgi:hypothetical protein
MDTDLDLDFDLDEDLGGAAGGIGGSEEEEEEGQEEDGGESEGKPADPGSKNTRGFLTTEPAQRPREDVLQGRFHEPGGGEALEDELTGGAGHNLAAAGGRRCERPLISLCRPVN